MMETTVTLDWDPPQGTGPESVVDNYTVSISPAPPYELESTTVQLPPWNVTLDHNIQYSISLTTTNCIGESNASAIITIRFSK